MQDSTKRGFRFTAGAAASLALGFTVVQIVQAWEGPYQQLWAGLAVAFFVLAAILFVVGWWSWLKATFCRLVGGWRRIRGVPQTTGPRQLGWGDSEVQAQQAVGTIHDLFARFDKQVDRHVRVMSGVERRTTAAVMSVVKQQKAASKNARALIRSNRKMRKHAIPIKDALLEIAEGYLKQIKWLSKQNGAEQKLSIQKGLFQSVIRIAESRHAMYMSVRDTLRSLRNVDAFEDMNNACEAQIETLNLIISASFRVKHDLSEAIRIIDKRLKP